MLANSMLGKGTVFKINLPCKFQPMSQNAAPAQLALPQQF